METIYKCSFCNKLCKNANSLRNHERLCKSNPNRQLTNYEKNGPIAGFNTKGRVAWNKGLTAETNDSIAKYQQVLKAKYKAGELTMPKPFLDPAVKLKHKESMKKAYSNYTKRTPGKFKYGWYKDIWCDSSWELAYLLYCIDHNIKIQRNKLGFSYLWDNSIHTYFPDFYLPDTNTYVEVKGYKSKRDEAKISQFKETLLIVDTEVIKPILVYVQAIYGKQFTDLYTSTKTGL